MKPKVYIILIAVLLIVEAWAVYLLISGGLEGFNAGIATHITASILFGFVTGVHRRSVFVGLLTAMVIAMTPLIGVLTMTLLDDKFNRANRQKSSRSTGSFTVGNPFISKAGNVELPEIKSLVAERQPAMERVLQVEYRLSESEVNSLSYTRGFELLPLFEKIAGTTSGDGRLLAQAAIDEIQDRTAIWCANLHRMQLHQKPIPVSLQKLAVNTWIEIKKQGRNPQSFGLPEEGELIAMLEGRLENEPCPDLVTDLFELLLLGDHDEQAAQLLTEHRALPGLNFTYLAAKFRSNRGEWAELVKLAPQFDELPLSPITAGSRRFWGVDRSANPTPRAL